MFWLFNTIFEILGVIGVTKGGGIIGYGTGKGNGSKIGGGIIGKEYVGRGTYGVCTIGGMYY